MTFLARTFLKWLPLGVGLTLAIGLAYVEVQQSYRQSGNDPQIQMAEDAAAQLSNGAQPDEVLPTTDRIDMAASLSPWLTVYDDAGTPLSSTGYIHGEMPALPNGVFSTSTWHTYAEDGLALPVPQSETRFSWQSGAGLREAVVLVRYTSSNGSGFVAAGRDLEEIENREGVLTEMTAIGWVVTMFGTLAAQALAEYLL
jgi:hypothetical protein